MTANYSLRSLPREPQADTAATRGDRLRAQAAAAAANTDLFLTYEYKSRTLVPTPETVSAFRANISPVGADATDDEIAQVIAELVHREGFTEPTDLHEIRLVGMDMAAFWRHSGTGEWKSFTWKSAGVPYVAPWLAAHNASLVAIESL